MKEEIVHHQIYEGDYLKLLQEKEISGWRLIRLDRIDIGWGIVYVCIFEFEEE